MSKFKPMELIDKMSGKSADRPKLKEMLEKAKNMSFEDAKAKNLLFSDMVKTDFIKNYIVNNYSKEFYNGILSNIRTDYDPVIKEDETGLYTEYYIQIVQSMI